MFKELTKSLGDIEDNDVSVMISSFYDIPMKNKEKQAIQNLRNFLNLLEDRVDGKRQIEREEKTYIGEVKESIEILRQYAAKLND